MSYKFRALVQIENSFPAFFQVKGIGRLLRVFICNDHLPRGSHSIKGEVGRREELVCLCRGFTLVCRGWRGENGSEGFLIGGDGEVVNE